MPIRYEVTLPKAVITVIDRGDGWIKAYSSKHEGELFIIPDDQLSSLLEYLEACKEAFPIKISYDSFRVKDRIYSFHHISMVDSYIREYCYTPENVRATVECIETAHEMLRLLSSISGLALIHETEESNFTLSKILEIINNRIDQLKQD